MRIAFNRLAVLILFVAAALIGSAPVQAGPDVRDLSETNLASSSVSPFHLNTDRYKEAFQSINGYLTAHEELPANSIMIADDHGHFLHGVVSSWTYYTYGTHKGIELYVFNPEDGTQFLTVEVWLPKEQQRNQDKRDSYNTSFQQIESFLAGSSKYRMDLVFQDEVPVMWGKGYEFKLDDEGISVSFTVMNGARPRAKAKEMAREMKEMPKPTAIPVMTPTVKAEVTVQPTVVEKAVSTHKAHKKKKSKASSESAVPTTAPTVAASSPDAR